MRLVDNVTKPSIISFSEISVGTGFRTQSGQVFIKGEWHGSKTHYYLNVETGMIYNQASMPSFPNELLPDATIVMNYKG